VAHGQELVWQPPQEGDAQRWAILRALALVDPGSRPLAELLARARPKFRGRTSLVIITPSVGGEWVEELWPLLRRGVVPTILLLDPLSFDETFGGSEQIAEAKSGTLGLMSNLGVTHYAIGRDLLDRPEARPGEAGRWEWKVSPLGRAVTARRPGELAWKVLS
jgi:uncharacterized protein (DUF58 family)